MNCIECGNSHIYTTEHEIICNTCGLVIDENHQENVGIISPLTNAGTFQYDGKIVKTGWIFSKQEKTLYAAKKEVYTITSRLHLPERIATETLHLLATAARKNLIKGRNTTTLLHALTYAACRIQRIPKTVSDIILHTDISKRSMLRMHSKLARALRLKQTAVNPPEFLPRFGSELALNPLTITRAAIIIESYNKRINITGKRPEAIAAAALYLAAKENSEYRTQRQIANVTGVIEITIRKYAKELCMII